DDVITVLRNERELWVRELAGIPAGKVDYRYAPEKWTIRQVLGHVIDMEMVFAARALHFARAVDAPMPGVDQDPAMKASTFERSPWPDLVAWFDHQRMANILMFQGLDEAGWNRSGVASGVPVTVRGLAHILAGHQRHHAKVIRERYLG
ncbi:MAG TPA: DinB family protein, partial [Candidatus Krumholzibacteria bacterium]